MMTVNFSQGIILARVLGEMEAKAASFPEIIPDHLWMALTKLSELREAVVTKLLNAGPADQASLNEEIRRLREWFTELNLNSTETRRALRRQVGRGAGPVAGLHRSADSVARYQAAVSLAEREGSPVADAIHLGRSILMNPSSHLAAVLNNPNAAPAASRPDRIGELVRFGRDVTAQAAEGQLDPLIGRREELLRLAQVLSQKRKGNAILVGDAGVGKTCIVEGLAQKIASPDGPPAFKNKRIIEISMTALTAGTAHRGDLENRIQTILDIAESDPNLILFMDEIHMLMTKSGGQDPADIFKPALARGKLKMIGATTTPEYDQYLAKDEAIARRFEMIWVEEPTRDEAIDIVSGIKPDLETHHAVTIAADAVDAAVDLSIRYIPDRRLPDKALDLLDQACSQQVVDFLTARSSPGEGSPSQSSAPGKQVDRSDIARVVSQRTRIPFDMLAATDQERIKTLREFLNIRIVGQEEAMETVYRALRSAFHGLRDPRRPLSSFLFAGPSGVGKTETAKALSEFLFGDANRLVRIDLSEFTERHQIARLIGAPPGYVGSESPGMLTAAMRHQPASVVLFDEIEKGHPDVLNILLQILDEGFLTDGQGKKAIFRESVVVLTTNIMPPADHRPPIGFGAADGKQATEMGSNRLMEALGQHLRPELLGRLHNIILFRALTTEALMAIADGVFEKMADRLRSQNISLPENLREEIRRSVGTGNFNAREIERRVEAAVARWLENRFASNSGESPPAPEPDSVLYTVMPKIPSMDMALLVLDLVQSTRMVCDSGDTVFSNVIGDLFQRLRTQAAGDQLLFMKCTGDGFLVAYQTVSDAVSVGLSFLDEPSLAGNRFRIALHWGNAKIGPGGDPLGAEVHRVFRMESIQEEDRAGGDRADKPLPAQGRILVSQEALEQMTPPQRIRFRPAGSFRLKGFDAPVAVWAASGDVG